MATRRATDIDRIKPQVCAGSRCDADKRSQEFRVAGNDGGRQPALAHEIGRAIGIGEHRLEQFGALDESGFERLPFRSLDQERHVAQRPRPFGPGRVLVDAVERAGLVQVAIGGGETPAQLLRTQSCEHR